MACDPMNFQNVTPEMFKSLSKKLEGLGYSLQGTSGIIRGPMSIVIEYNYNEMTRTLDAVVQDKSFFVPCSRIQAELSKAIESSRR